MELLSLVTVMMMKVVIKEILMGVYMLIVFMAMVQEVEIRQGMVQVGGLKIEEFLHLELNHYNVVMSLGG